MRFILFIGIVQSILFLGHWFLYETLVRFLGMTNPARLLTLKIALGLLSVSLVLTSLLAFRYTHLLVQCLYTVAVYWLGIFYLFILAAALCWIFFGLAKLRSLPFNKTIWIEILMGMSLMASLYGFINAGVIRMTHIDLQFPYLPDRWKGKTAVWVSDLHLGQVRNEGLARQIAARVEDLRPDIVFIGGDLYDGVATDLDKAIKPFSRIAVPYGTFFITGHHEEFGDHTPYLEAVRRAGIRVLYNEKVQLDGLQIIGVNYRDSRNQEQFRAILQKMNIDPQH